jgi:hypothetical protein
VFGFDNIAANNGWAMAAVGATIVFLGLVVLSFVISQIHRILELVEKKEAPRTHPEATEPAEKTLKVQAPAPGTPHLPSASELVPIYRPLVEQLAEPFELSQLYELSNKMDLAHPHLSIKQLWEANVLVSKGDGTFTWNKSLNS